MSPLATQLAATIFCTAGLWRSLGGADEVIVGDRPVPSRPAGRRATFLSASTRGSTPCSAAVFTILMPCSSVPVRKRVSSPGQAVIAGERVAAIVV